mgnify:CR=1 FL=1
MNKPNGEKPPQQPYPYTWVSDAELNLDSRYLVKGLIEQGSFTLIFGPSGSGKSFFTADLAQHIATGTQWRGRKVNQSLVVYVASEAGASILKRFVGWRENRLGEAAERIPLAVLTRGPNLILKQQVEYLRNQLAYMQDEAKLPIGWIVFDTLSRSMPGGDENKAEDMTEVISAADYLRDEFRAATGFVHHSGKDVERGARGHSSLFAAADCVLRVDERVATIDKVRDGVSGERFPFSLQPIILGQDSDGEDVTTCLLSESETGAQPLRPMKGLGKNQKPILDAIRQLVSDEGVRSPGTSAIPAGVLTVRFESLCARMEPKFPGMKPWQVKRRVGEAITGLEGSGHAGVHGEHVWLR